MHVRGQLVDIGDVENLLFAGQDEGSGDLEVHIRADRSVPYRVIRPIVISCVRAGVTRFQFPVLLQ